MTGTLQKNNTTHDTHDDDEEDIPKLLNDDY